MRNGLSDSDENIIARIKRGDEAVLRELYLRNYRIILNHITRNSGSEEEARDIFQEAIVVLWEKTVQDRLSLTSSIGTYLFKVCENLWLKELRKKKNFPQDKLQAYEEIIDDVGSTEDEEIQLNRRQQIVQQCMSDLKETCRAIIHYFYFDRLSMKDIALKLGLKNEDVAKNIKSRCLKKLKELVLIKITAGE